MRQLPRFAWQLTKRIVSKRDPASDGDLDLVRERMSYPACSIHPTHQVKRATRQRMQDRCLQVARLDTRGSQPFHDRRVRFQLVFPYLQNGRLIGQPADRHWPRRQHTTLVRSLKESKFTKVLTSPVPRNVMARPHALQLSNGDYEHAVRTALTLGDDVLPVYSIK